MKLPFSFSFFAKKDRYEKRMIHPMREWFIGIGVCTLCVLAAAGHSAYTFVLFENVSISKESGNQGEEVAYKRTLVETVLKRYEDRANEYRALMDNAPIVVPVEPTSVETPDTQEEGIDETTSTTTQEVMLGV